MKILNQDITVLDNWLARIIMRKPFAATFGRNELVEVEGELDVKITYSIVVNEKYVSLPKPLQEAGIAHEMGHIHHKHIEGLVAGGGGVSNDQQAEYEADDYAVQMGYKDELIELLTLLVPRYTITNNQKQGKAALLDRIQRLKSI